jgi:hypothetical protein
MIILEHRLPQEQLGDTKSTFKKGGAKVTKYVKLTLMVKLLV